MLIPLLRDILDDSEIVEPAGDGGTALDGTPPIRAFAMDICAALMPPAARDTGRALAARAAFWMAVVAVVLRAPVGWRREGPDMALGQGRYFDASAGGLSSDRCRFLVTSSLWGVEGVEICRLFTSPNQQRKRRAKTYAQPTVQLVLGAASHVFLSRK